MHQLKLPYKKLNCANPSCKNEAGHNDFVCSMECYERMRIAGLSTEPRYFGDGTRLHLYGH
jgi:hypothetical protein